MSQAAAKKRMVLRNERVTVLAHFHEEGSVLQGSQLGACEDFSIELSMDGEHSPEEIGQLMGLAHRMCFTESALTSVVPITTHHVFNGVPIAVSAG